MEFASVNNSEKKKKRGECPLLDAPANAAGKDTKSVNVKHLKLSSAPFNNTRYEGPLVMLNTFIYNIDKLFESLVAMSNSRYLSIENILFLAFVN